MVERNPQDMNISFFSNENEQTPYHCYKCLWHRAMRKQQPELEGNG